MGEIKMEEIMEAIKKTFGEMFKKHEDNMLKIIAANHQLENQRIDKLFNEMNGLKESLEFTQSHTEEKLETANGEIKKLQEEIKELKEIPRWGDDLRKRVVEQEDRSRRNNLRFEGIAESPNETWDECAANLYKFLYDKLQINTQYVCIERAHRASGIKDGKPRVIVAKFLNYKDKTDVLKNCGKLKGSNFCVYEDFSKETTVIRKEKWKQVLQNRKDGFISHLNYRTIVRKERLK